jgi:hypothetical protein
MKGQLASSAAGAVEDIVDYQRDIVHQFKGSC